jgi:hypothetical protein
MSLNPEPAAPEERAELNLAPKSYADAAEQALEPASSPHANGGTDGTADEGKQRPEKQVENGTKPNGIKIAVQDQTERLEGVGLDASPKSPTAKGHRRKGSRSSMGSVGRKHGEQITSDSDIFVEKHPNSHGDALVSVKAAPALDKDRRTDVKRRDSELKSGRQAGAGWATSKCVYQLLRAAMATYIDRDTG